MIRRLHHAARVVNVYANQALVFLLLCGLVALICCPVLAVAGMYGPAIGALNLALILGVPSSLGILGRHINPKEEDHS